MPVLVHIVGLLYMATVKAHLHPIAIRFVRIGMSRQVSRCTYVLGRLKCRRVVLFLQLVILIEASSRSSGIFVNEIKFELKLQFYCSLLTVSQSSTFVTVSLAAFRSRSRFYLHVVDQSLFLIYYKFIGVRKGN